MVAAGDFILASDVNRPVPVQASSPDNNAVAITATSPSNGETICGATFVAPASGRVHIGWNGAIQSVSGQVFGGPQVRTGATIGSGTVVYNPNSDPGCKTGTSTAQTVNGGASCLLEGLTPGSTYNICATTWVSSGSMNYFSRQVFAFPLD